MKLSAKQKTFCYFTGILLGLSVKLFIIDIVRVQGNSMEPTIKDGSSVLINKLAYGIIKPFGSSRFCSWQEPQVNDIVIYLHNNNMVIKRIIATSNTPLDYSTNKGYTLFVNNKSYPLSKEQYKTMQNTQKVPEGTVLAIGDNYEVSIDSRNYGFIPVYNVLGKAVCQ